MRELLRLEIGSAATLQRRLRHLRARGAIVQTRSRDDARIIEISLSPRAQKVFDRYLELLGIPRGSEGVAADAGGA
jgi:DNA-binding MarR family transcriptional regulator